MSFNELATEIHNERQAQRYYDYNQREINGDNIYLDYCIWCNCNNRVCDKKNMTEFGAWLKSEQISLTNYQRKHIAKKHFGAEIEYNYKTNKWEIK